MVGHFPDGESAVRCRVPLGVEFCRFEEADAASPRFNKAGANQAIDACVLGLGKLLGDAEVSLREAVLLEPRQCPATVRIDVAFLL